MQKVKKAQTVKERPNMIGIVKRRKREAKKVFTFQPRPTNVVPKGSWKHTIYLQDECVMLCRNERDEHDAILMRKDLLRTVHNMVVSNLVSGGWAYNMDLKLWERHLR